MLLRPILHYTAIREFELDDSVFAKADVTAIHTRAGTLKHHLPPGIDRLPGVHQEPSRDWSIYREIGDFITGRVQGRSRPDQVTLFLNNIGTGIQFAAMGHCVLNKAKEMGLGNEIPGDWFLQDIKP